LNSEAQVINDPEQKLNSDQQSGQNNQTGPGHKGRKSCPPKWPQISPQGGAKVPVTKDSGTLPTPGARTNPHPDGTDEPQLLSRRREAPTARNRSPGAAKWGAKP